jgi:hypothetical protein
MNYKVIFVAYLVFTTVSCADSKYTGEENSVTPNLTKSKHYKLDSLNVITVPSPTLNKELSKPDENAPKTKKGSN